MATSSIPAPSDAARNLRDMDEEFMRNVRARDVRRLVEQFYADDARLLPPGRPELTGKAEILEGWTGMFAGGLEALELDTHHIEASGDLAYGVGTYRLTMNGALSRGKYVVVYRRRPDGSYKAVADIFNASE
jgi:ketosteroid isomerase-like protein